MKNLQIKIAKAINAILDEDPFIQLLIGTAAAFVIAAIASLLPFGAKTRAYICMALGAAVIVAWLTIAEWAEHVLTQKQHAKDDQEFNEAVDRAFKNLK